MSHRLQAMAVPVKDIRRYDCSRLLREVNALGVSAERIVSGGGQLLIILKGDSGDLDKAIVRNAIDSHLPPTVFAGRVIRTSEDIDRVTYDRIVQVLPPGKQLGILTELIEGIAGDIAETSDLADLKMRVATRIETHAALLTARREIIEEGRTAKALTKEA